MNTLYPCISSSPTPSKKLQASSRRIYRSFTRKLVLCSLKLPVRSTELLRLACYYLIEITTTEGVHNKIFHCFPRGWNKYSYLNLVTKQILNNMMYFIEYSDWICTDSIKINYNLIILHRNKIFVSRNTQRIIYSSQIKIMSLVWKKFREIYFYLYRVLSNLIPKIKILSW